MKRLKLYSLVSCLLIATVVHASQREEPTTRPSYRFHHKRHGYHIEWWKDMTPDRKKLVGYMKVLTEEEVKQVNEWLDGKYADKKENAALIASKDRPFRGNCYALNQADCKKKIEQVSQVRGRHVRRR